MKEHNNFFFLIFVTAKLKLSIHNKIPLRLMHWIIEKFFLFGCWNGTNTSSSLRELFLTILEAGRPPRRDLILVASRAGRSQLAAGQLHGGAALYGRPRVRDWSASRAGSRTW